MARERFSFNDTKEYNKDDLQPNNDLHAGQTGKFTFDDEIEEKPKKVKKVKKTKQPKNGKKLKLKKWHIFITVLVVLIVAFLLYIFVFSGNNKGPVYGQRCVKLLSVDQNTVSQVESQIEQDDRIQDLAVKVDCRTIKLTYQLVDNVSADDAMGQQKDDGAAWSQLLNKANGRLQYDLEIIVKSNGDSDFPLFGTKHAGIDDITYTGQNVKDQDAANKAIQRQAEVDAANAANQ